MEADENHRKGTCKRSRTGPPEVEEEDGDGLTGRAGLRPWNQQASRIFLVSRASGGKDRHSKVYTSKGLRDRRVRLSVSTAIQFYDLQDRLGYDQPSKAIDWLIKTAAAAISELPTIETSFPLEPPKPETDHHHEIEPPKKQHWSSASETSKGSVLCLSRSKTRDRSATKEKDPDDNGVVNHGLNSQSSFTDLLNGTPITDNPIQKQIRYLPMAATADYFSHEAIFGKTNQNPLFTSITHNGNGAPMGMVPFTTAALAMGDYSLNYSSCPAGFNRGTLQSNSPHQLSHHQHPHIQRLSYPVDGSNLPFFLGSAPSTAAVVNSCETQLPDGFDGRLQLCFSDWHGVSELKGKAKS